MFYYQAEVPQVRHSAARHGVQDRRLLFQAARFDWLRMSIQYLSF